MQGTIVATGLGGAFEVNGLQAKTILSEPTRSAFASDSGTLFLSTYRDKVHVLRYDVDEWKMMHFLDDLHDQINFMFQGVGDEVWLCALDNVYRLDMANGKPHNVETAGDQQSEL